MNQSRLSALKILLRQADISLLTLNAPHSTMNGVIPLGMAAWLNQPLAVRTLLDDSVQSVAVDGMDSHGATALMCTWIALCKSHVTNSNPSDAARDGNLDVAKILVGYGY